jgi:hypothetical protein
MLIFIKKKKKGTWSNQPLQSTDIESSTLKAWSVAELNNGDVVVGTKEGDLTLWRIKKNGRFELIKVIPCHTRPIDYLETLGNGNVACSFGYATIQICNLESGVMLHRLCNETGIYQMVQLSNGHLASLSRDDTVTVWNVENGQRST